MGGKKILSRYGRSSLSVSFPFVSNGAHCLVVLNGSKKIMKLLLWELEWQVSPEFTT